MAESIRNRDSSCASLLYLGFQFKRRTLAFAFVRYAMPTERHFLERSRADLCFSVSVKSARRMPLLIVYVCVNRRAPDTCRHADLRGRRKHITLPHILFSSLLLPSSPYFDLFFYVIKFYLLYIITTSSRLRLVRSVNLKRGRKKR